MFDKWRFKRYYKTMMDERKLSPNEWTISLKDVYDLYQRIPKKIVDQFDKEEIHHLRNFVGDFYYPNVMDALDACRAATVAMRETAYIDGPQPEAVRLPLDAWLQPDGIVCHFGELLREATELVVEFTNTVEAVEKAKVGYYKRKTVAITRDLFSLGEMLAELVMRD